MTSYQQLIFTCSAEQASTLSDWLAEQTAILAISLVDAEDQPIYEPKLDAITLWDKVELEVLVDADYPMENLLLSLNLALAPLPPYRLEHLNERDWVTESQSHFPPQCFSQRLWLYPAWQEVPTDLNLPVLRLSPGLAFGTGTHPTTRLCLSWLAEYVQGGESLIDYGCGSGILGLAALVLGAKHVSAVDLDPQALQATLANAALNHLDATKLALFLPEAFKPDAPVDVLVANILAAPLIAMAEYFQTLLKPGARLVLSGILNEQKSEVIKAYAPFMDLSTYGDDPDWCALIGIKAL